MLYCKTSKATITHSIKKTNGKGIFFLEGGCCCYAIHTMWCLIPLVLLPSTKQEKTPKGTAAAAAEQLYYVYVYVELSSSTTLCLYMSSKTI